MSIAHNGHQHYCDKELQPEVIEFIEDHLESTPRQIHQDIVAPPVLGPLAKDLSQKQVHYWWNARSASTWHLCDDPFESIAKGLGSKHMLKPDENPAEYLRMLASSQQSEARGAMGNNRRTIKSTMVGQTIVKESETRGFVLYAVDIITALRSRTVEISLDATYGTNSSSHDLFAVLAELDGTGAPLLYLFMDTKEMLGDRRRIEILADVMAVLKGMGIDPQFVGCDKDSAEIAAIGQVWPGAKIQLCYWHVRRALRQRFSLTKASGTNTYDPWDAAKTVAGLELDVCWGVKEKRRHDLRVCSCPSRRAPTAKNPEALNRTWDNPGRLEMEKEDNEALVNFICRHYNMHPCFPSPSGVKLTAEQLRKQAATEAYQLVKHDYLHRFARPRVDLVAYIIRTRLVPHTCTRIQALLDGNARIAKPSWKRAFVKLWRKAEAREDVSAETLARYRTCPHLWTCACESFLESRFLFCKHLIKSVEPMSTSRLQELRRHREPPFWTHSELKPLDASNDCRHCRSTGLAGRGEEADGGGQEEEEEAGEEGRGEDELEIEEDEDDVEDLDLHDSDGEEDEPSVAQRFEEMRAVLTRMLMMLDREEPWGSRAFIDAVLRSNRQNMKLLDEDERRLARQLHPRTWERGQHSATMYLRGKDAV
ncbi:hypothetical protein OC844_005089 [Tilletia horrida]|nr:hypothetical protein OC844_005089 [Tilletia horrida]